MDVAIHQLVEVKGSDNKLLVGCGSVFKHNRGARFPDSITTDMTAVTCEGCLKRVADYHAAKDAADKEFNR